MILHKIDIIRPLREMLIKLDSEQINENESPELVKNLFVSKVALKANGLPLYVKFVIEDIMKKKIIIGSEPVLPDSLEDYYIKLINRYGIGDLSQIVTPLLCLLTLAKEPLTFDEMYEYLFIRELLLTEQILEKAIKTIKPLIKTELNSFDNFVYSIYHDSLREFIKKSPLTSESLKLSNNFICKLVKQKSSFDCKLGNYILKWGIYHLIDNNKIDEVVDLLTNITFLESKAKAGQSFNLVKMISDALESIPEEHKYFQSLKLINKALRNNIHFIDSHLIDYPQSLFQCVWNSAWWHGRTLPASNYKVDQGQTVSDKTQLNIILEKWLNEKLKKDPDFIWLCFKRPPSIPLDSALSSSIEGKSDLFIFIKFLPCRKKIMSIESDNTDIDNPQLFITTRIWNINDLSEECSFTIKNPYDDYDIKNVRIENIVSEVKKISVSDDCSKMAFLIFDDIQIQSKENDFEDISDNIQAYDSSIIVNKILIYDVNIPAIKIIKLKFSKEFDVCFSPDGKHIAAINNDSISIFETSSCSEVNTFSINGMSASKICFSYEGNKIASAWNNVSNDYSIITFDISSGAIAKSHKSYRNLTKINYSPDGNFIAFNNNYEIIVMNAQTLDESKILNYHKDIVTDLCFSPCSDKLVSTGMDKLLILWNLKDIKIHNIFYKSNEAISNICFSREGYLIASTEKSKIRLWDTSYNSNFELPQGHFHSIKKTYRSIGIDILGTVDDNNLMLFWDSKSEIPVGELKFDEPLIFAYIINKSDVAILKNNNLIEFYNYKTRIKYKVMQIKNYNNISKFSISSDEKFIATIIDFSIKIFDLSTEKIIITSDHFENQNYNEICFSKDGKFLFTNTIDNKTILFNLDTFKPEKIIDIPIDIFQLANNSNYRIYPKNNEILVESLNDKKVVAYLNGNGTICNNHMGAFIRIESGSHVQIVSLEGNQLSTYKQ